MATLDRRYYYVPRRLVYRTLLALVAVVALIALGAWLSAPRWLPQVAFYLDVDVPIAEPDAVVVNAAGQSTEIDRRVARLVADRPVETIVLLGSPFTSDVLVPERRSPRVASLTGLGVPPAAIVELYQGERLDESFAALRDLARTRGWRRVVLYGNSPGTRRSYLLARRILGEAGVAVGQTTVPSPQFDPERWWADNRDRGRVVFEWMRLGIGWAAGKY